MGCNHVRVSLSSYFCTCSVRCLQMFLFGVREPTYSGLIDYNDIIYKLLRFKRKLTRAKASMTKAPLFTCVFPLLRKGCLNIASRPGLCNSSAEAVRKRKLPLLFVPIALAIGSLFSLFSREMGRHNGLLWRQRTLSLPANRSPPSVRPLVN